MKINIFYSWQSDLPSKTNRTFIQDSIKKAIQRLTINSEYELIIDLQRDTLGQIGAPNIVETIFKKIDSSDIFIADISIINPESSQRRAPNPNVLLELGYAAGTMSWDNVICIFNENAAHVNELPFDLRTRRLVIYNAAGSQNGTSKNELAEKIAGAIKSIRYEQSVERKQTRKVFAFESEKAQHLAITRPTDWCTLLFCELLESKMTFLNKHLEDFEKGLIFRKIKLLDDVQFFDWFRLSLETFTQFFEVTGKLLNQAMAIAHEARDAIAIKDATDKLVSGCQELVDWEIELQCLRVPEELENIKETLKGCSRESLVQISSIPTQIKTILKNSGTNSTATVTITYDAPPALATASELFQTYLRSHR